MWPERIMVPSLGADGISRRLARRLIRQYTTFTGLPCYYPSMPDQIIDAAMARSLHVDACRAHPMVGWVIVTDPPHYPGKFVARLVTDAPSSYVLVANTLAEIH